MTDLAPPASVTSTKPSSPAGLARSRPWRLIGALALVCVIAGLAVMVWRRSNAVSSVGYVTSAASVGAVTSTLR